MIDLKVYAQALVQKPGHLRLHPEYLGTRFRDDAWSCTQWQRIEDFHILLIVDAGFCEITYQQKQLRLGPGDAILLAPMANPDIAFSQQLHFHEIYFSVGTEQIQPALQHIRAAWELCPHLDEIAALHQRQDAQSLIGHQLAFVLSKFAYLLQEQESQTGLSIAQSNKIIQWTREHIYHQPNPNDIAALLDLTPDYCARVFRQSFGINPRDWLIKERMHEAARRLREGDDSIERIAEELGYTNPAHFSRQFKKVMHSTPSHWRTGK